MDWIRNVYRLGEGNEFEFFRRFSLTQAHSLAAVFTRISSRVDTQTNVKQSQISSTPSIKPPNIIRLRKSVRFFQNRACRKLQPGRIDPLLEKAKDRMVEKSKKDWGIPLKVSNPIHYLAALFEAIHSPGTLHKAYLEVQSIRRQVARSISPQATHLQKMKVLYKIIETRFPYGLMDDFFKGINVGKLDCDTVAMMALFVAHELGWNLKMVYAPRHAFVRWDDCRGPTVNMDLKNTGSQTDQDYARTIPKPGIKSGAYLQSLSELELIGHFLLMKADILKGLQKDREALKNYNLANKYSPKNHYILINRAYLLYSMGKLDAGHRDLDSARRLVPDNGTYVTQIWENYRYKKYSDAEKLLLQAFPFPSLSKLTVGVTDPKERADLLIGKIGEKLVALGIQHLSQNNLALSKKQFNWARILLNLLSQKKQLRYFESLIRLHAYQGLVHFRYGKYGQARGNLETLNDLGIKMKNDPKTLGKYRQIYRSLIERTETIRNVLGRI